MPRRLSIVPVVIALAVIACRLQPLRLLAETRAASAPAITLRRCDEVRDVLCVLTFAMQPPDGMLIILLVTPGLPQELKAVVIHNGSALSYPCASSEAEVTMLSCAGPQLPLGSRLRVEVYSKQPDTLLAGGDFDLIALAWPTLPVGGPVLLTPPPSATARPTRTPINVTPAASPLSLTNTSPTPAASSISLTVTPTQP